MEKCVTACSSLRVGYKTCKSLFVPTHAVGVTPVKGEREKENGPGWGLKIRDDPFAERIWADARDKQHVILLKMWFICSALSRWEICVFSLATLVTNVSAISPWVPSRFAEIVRVCWRRSTKAIREVSYGWEWIGNLNRLFVDWRSRSSSIPWLLILHPSRSCFIPRVSLWARNVRDPPSHAITHVRCENRDRCPD